MGLRIPPSLNRLKSLFKTAPLSLAEAHLAHFGLSLRPLDDGMARSGEARRRSLADEGRRLLLHLVGGPTPQSLIRRYVRVLEQAGTSADLSETKKRILIATRVLEASTLGADLMLARRSDGIARATSRLGASLIADGLLQLRSWFQKLFASDARRA